MTQRFLRSFLGADQGGNNSVLYQSILLFAFEYLIKLSILLLFYVIYFDH
jgi:hypothetical protein